jgi:hypothetical protein
MSFSFEPSALDLISPTAQSLCAPLKSAHYIIHKDLAHIENDNELD